MRRISTFLGIQLKPQVFDFYKSKESQNTAVAGKMWANVTKPILKGNSNKYKKELSEMEVGIFEKQAGAILKELAYKLEKTGVINGRAYTSNELNSFESENSLLKEQALKSTDPEGMKRREGQELLIKDILSRT